MRLRGKVHDRVDLLGLEHKVHEVRGADVALDELVVGQLRDLVEVLDARAVVEPVEVDDLVLRVPATGFGVERARVDGPGSDDAGAALLREQDDDVRRDEARPARDLRGFARRGSSAEAAMVGDAARARG